MRNFDDDELRNRVDEVLFYVWDPIGVNEEPYARAEYESYVPRVLELLEESDDIGPISAFLADTVRDEMALSPDQDKCSYTAELLARNKKAIREGCA